MVTSILLSQITSPPGRTASTLVRNDPTLPAASMTTSAPRPHVRFRAAAAASSVFTLTPNVAPIRCANASFASSTSQAMISAAPAKARPLHGRKSHRAASNDHDGVGAADPRQIQCRAYSRHDAASDQAGTVEGNLLRDRDRLLLGDDAIFCEGAEEHQISELLPTAQSRLPAPVEGKRLRPTLKIILAQDRQSTVAIEAVAAMRVPGEDNVIALAQLAHRSAYVLHDPCSFVTQDDRHGILQRAFDHFQIGVAKSRGLHPHEHICTAQRCGDDPLDRERSARRMQHRRFILQVHGRRDQPEFAKPEYFTFSNRLSLPRLRGKPTSRQP